MRQYRPLRTPPEILLLILDAVDSKSTLLAWCCLCHGCHDEGEPRLYRNVTLSSVFHVRTFLRALKKAPRRALLVRSLSVLDKGHLHAVDSFLNEIFLKLSNLRHLLLELSYARHALYDSVMSTLNMCSFTLYSFEPGRVDGTDDLFTFLTRQSAITYLNLIRYELEDEPEGLLPQDALPCLKYLDADHSFFMRQLRNPRLITHLSITELPDMGPGLQEVLDIVGDQLVSLKCGPIPPGYDGPPVNPPTVPFRVAALPRLRYLEVGELMYYNRVRRFLTPAKRRLPMLT